MRREPVVEALAASPGLRVPVLGLSRPGLLREPEVWGMSGELCSPYCEAPCSPACGPKPGLLRLAAVEWFAYSHGPTMVQVAGVEGLCPRDLVGRWVQIDDYECHVQAATPSAGASFALMLDACLPVEVSE